MASGKVFRPLHQGAANIVSFFVLSGVVIPYGVCLKLMSAHGWASRAEAADPTVLFSEQAETFLTFAPLVVVLVWAVLVNRLVQDGRLGAWSLSVPIVRPWRLVKIVAIGFLVLAPFWAAWAVQFGQLVYADRIVIRDGFPWPAEETVPVSSFRAVRTGCAHRISLASNKHDLPVYTIILSDGRERRLDRVRSTVGHGPWLDGLERLDAEVRRQGIERRVSRDAEGRPERSTTCIAYFDRILTPDQSATFRRVLDLPARASSR